MFDKLGVAWATSLLGFITLAMMPIPWVLRKWGPQIRNMSSFDALRD